MAAREAWSNWLIVWFICSNASSHSRCPGALSLISKKERKEDDKKKRIKIEKLNKDALFVVR